MEWVVLELEEIQLAFGLDVALVDLKLVASSVDLNGVGVVQAGFLGM